jgi:hypothetical protein
LKSFPNHVSAIATSFWIWRLKAVPTFRLWANVHLRFVSPFSVFAFRHQLKQLPNPASFPVRVTRTVRDLHTSPSNPILAFPDLVIMHFRIVHGFNRFAFRPALVTLPVWHSRDPESGPSPLIQEICFSEFPVIFWLISADAALFVIRGMNGK